jgi:hypothetical protein
VKTSQKFGNFFVTATKSGKLQKETYECCLEHVIKLYLKKVTTDNPALYNKKFLDKVD